MLVRHLSLVDFRSYPSAEVALGPGAVTIVGSNGHGKTNLVEAVGYLAALESHRVATDAPLVRFGAAQAIIRGLIERDTRQTLLELEINPGKANRARLGRAPVPRPREVLGTLRSVLFAPEDLALVKGDPSARRRFVDDLLVQRQPRWSAVRAEYDRIVKQRNALLKSAAPVLRRGKARYADPQATAAALHTLDVWDEQVAGLGSQLLYARLRLLRDLRGYLAHAYEQVSGGAGAAQAAYRSSLREQEAQAIAAGEVPEVDALRAAFHASLAAVRGDEIERGVSLVGPHRDDILLQLGELPAKGYASHGESWSFALGLKLAAYDLLRNDLGEDPVLVLDDVFAELDSGRRGRLGGLIAGCEQVLITAAVEEDIPDVLAGDRLVVARGSVAPGELAPTTP